jgi:hypothetical protein
MQVSPQLKTTYENIEVMTENFLLLYSVFVLMLVLMLIQKEILYLSMPNNPKRLQIKC